MRSRFDAVRQNILQKQLAAQVGFLKKWPCSPGGFVDHPVDLARAVSPPQIGDPLPIMGPRCHADKRMDKVSNNIKLTGAKGGEDMRKDTLTVA